MLKNPGNPEYPKLSSCLKHLFSRKSRLYCRKGVWRRENFVATDDEQDTHKQENNDGTQRKQDGKESVDRIRR